MTKLLFSTTAAVALALGVAAASAQGASDQMRRPPAEAGAQGGGAVQGGPGMGDRMRGGGAVQGGAEIQRGERGGGAVQGGAEMQRSEPGVRAGGEAQTQQRLQRQQGEVQGRECPPGAQNCPPRETTAEGEQRKQDQTETQQTAGPRDRKEEAAQKRDTEQAGDKAQKSDATASVPEKREEVKKEFTRVIKSRDFDRVDLDISISVGAVLPRERIVTVWHDVPQEICVEYGDIVPCSYKFIVLSNGNIVILQPDTFKVVLIIQA